MWLGKRDYEKITKVDRTCFLTFSHLKGFRYCVRDGKMCSCGLFLHVTTPRPAHVNGEAHIEHLCSVFLCQKSDSKGVHGIILLSILATLTLTISLPQLLAPSR